jgi:hypothetical protein
MLLSMILNIQLLHPFPPTLPPSEDISGYILAGSL